MATPCVLTDTSLYFIRGTEPAQGFIYLFLVFMGGVFFVIFIPSVNCAFLWAITFGGGSHGICAHALALPKNLQYSRGKKEKRNEGVKVHFGNDNQE